MDEVISRLQAGVARGDWPLLDDVQRGFDAACERNWSPAQDRQTVRAATYKETLNPWQPHSGENPSWFELFGAAAPNENIREARRAALRDRQLSEQRLATLGRGALKRADAPASLAVSKAMATPEGRVEYAKYLDATARLRAALK